jgi:hypothetical protein
VRRARGVLAAARVVGAVQPGRRVDDDEPEALLGHHACRLDQQLQLVVAVVRACVRDVVEHVLAVEPVALGDLHEPLRPEGALSVDVHGLALGAALLERQLRGDAQRVAKLRLARAELAKDLGDRARLDPALEQRVELTRSCR